MAGTKAKRANGEPESYAVSDNNRTRRTALLDIVAAAIQRADDLPCPDGYANLIDNDDLSDWSVFLADNVLIALAEQGINLVFEPLAAVSNMKTWPQGVRIEHGCKD